MVCYVVLIVRSVPCNCIQLPEWTDSEEGVLTVGDTLILEVVLHCLHLLVDQLLLVRNKLGICPHCIGLTPLPNVRTSKNPTKPCSFSIIGHSKTVNYLGKISFNVGCGLPFIGKQPKCSL